MKYNQLLSSLKAPALQARFRLIMPNEDYQFQAIAESVEFSFRSVAAKQRFAMAQQFNFPDVSSLENLNVTFYETYDWSVLNYLKKWKLLIRDAQGNYGPPSSYERNIVIQFLNYEDDSVIQEFEYDGVFPTETGAIQASYEDPSGRIQLQQTFAVRNML